jgi:outer membrane protein assembly factor BamB
MSSKTKFAVIICLGAAFAALAGDWPQFLGPTRNGVYAGAEISPTWPKDGPATVWQKSVGEGFSGPVVAAGKVILFHRSDNKEIVECFDGRTGESKWTSGYPTSYRDDFGFDEGPRATPTIEGGKIYTFGAEGMLQCLDFTNGKTLWQVNTKKDFASQKGFFGAACSPLVEGNAVLMNIGGRDGAGIVAFDKSSGKVLWKALDDEASYSSPVAATIAGHRFAFFFTRAGLVALNPADGAVQFQFPWRARANESVNAAAPLVIDDTVFISACYGTGAALLRVRDRATETIWSGDESLSCHYATSVQRDGFLYGIDGRADPGFSPSPSLRCVELKSGKVRWREDSVGAATVILAGGELLILTEQGELILAAAAPEGFKSLARAQVFPNGMRAYPALADGLFYARSKNKLFCLDLRRKNGQ